MYYLHFRCDTFNVVHITCLQMAPNVNHRIINLADLFPKGKMYLLDMYVVYIVMESISSDNDRFITMFFNRRLRFASLC